MNLLAEGAHRRGEQDQSLSFKLLRAGACYLAVQEANDLGGPQFGYRLVVK